MAALHLDNDVPIALAPYLRDMGHSVVTALDLGMTDAHDERHLFAAAAADRILITHNRKDYELLHAAWLYWSQAWDVRKNHAGILIPTQVPMPQLGPVVASFLSAERLLANRLWRWTPGGGWVDRSG